MCLLISSLPGKVLRTLVDIVRLAERFNKRSRLLTLRGLPSDSTSVLKAEPGKLDIKSREPSILFISLTIVEHSSN